jgi:hypothetical protein
MGLAATGTSALFATPLLATMTVSSTHNIIKDTPNNK